MGSCLLSWCCLLFWLAAVLTLQAQVASAVFNVTVHGKPLAGHNATVRWTRDQSDPSEFWLQKLRHGSKSPSPPIHVSVNQKQTEGNLSIAFNQSGKFHLNVLGHNKSQMRFHTLSSSQHFNVEEDQDDTTKPSPSVNSISTSTPVAEPASESSGPEKASGPEPAVIIAACLGALFFAIAGLIILFFVLRRRNRKAARGLPEYPFAPSPPPSQSWRLRNLWAKPAPQDSTTEFSTSVDMSTTVVSDNNRRWPDTINFYHTPRPPPNTVKKTLPRKGTSSVSNGTETSLSSIRFSQKTERQMELEERIEELNGKLALLQRIQGPGGRTDSRTLTNMRHDLRMWKWRSRIEKLQELMTSDWALGRTDIIPKGLYGAESTVA